MFISASQVNEIGRV